MKIRFVSKKKSRRQWARTYGFTVMTIGVFIRDAKSATDLQYLGFLFLFWGILSEFFDWLLRDGHPDKELSFWQHLGAFVIFIVVGFFAAVVIVIINK